MSDPAHKEYFHPNPYKHAAYEEVSFSDTVALTAGIGSVVGRARGVGNFGIVLSSGINIAGYKIEFYSEPGLINKLMEFNS